MIHVRIVLIKVGQCYVFLSKTLHSHRAPLHPRESVDSSKLFRQSEKKIWGNLVAHYFFVQKRVNTHNNFKLLKWYKDELKFKDFPFLQLVMFCLKEPDPSCGGETVLLKSQDLTALLDPEVIQKFEAKKIRYQAFLPNKNTGAGLQKSWQDRFWMDDPKVC